MLADNNVKDKDNLYVITVETGLKFGAGTGAKVGLTLYGIYGDTGYRRLKTNNDNRVMYMCT